MEKNSEHQKQEMKKFAQGSDGDGLKNLKDGVEKGDKNEKNKGEKTLKKKSGTIPNFSVKWIKNLNHLISVFLA